MKIINAISPKLITTSAVKSDYFSAAVARKKLTVILQHGTIGAGKKITVKVLNSTSVSGTDAEIIKTEVLGKDTETIADVVIIDVILSGEMKEYFAIEITGTAEALYCSALLTYDSKYKE